MIARLYSNIDLEKNVAKVGPLLTKLSGFAHGFSNWHQLLPLNAPAKMHLKMSAARIISASARQTLS